MKNASSIVDRELKWIARKSNVKDLAKKWDIPKVFPWQGIGLIPETTPLKDQSVSQDVFFLIRDYVFSRQGKNEDDVEFSTTPPLSFELGRLIEGYWRYFDEEEKSVVLSLLENLHVCLSSKSKSCYRPEFCLISVLNRGFGWLSRTGFDRVFRHLDAFADLEELLNAFGDVPGISFVREFCGDGKLTAKSWSQFRGEGMDAISTPCSESFMDLFQIATQMKLDELVFWESCMQMMELER